MKKFAFFIILLFLLLLCVPFLLSIGLKFYIPFKTHQDFGSDVVYITDKSGDFSSSGPYCSSVWCSRISCTRDVKDLPIDTIAIRAFLKFFNLDWNSRNNVLNPIQKPIHFGIVDDKNEVHFWSFKKMRYVSINELFNHRYSYYEHVIQSAKQCAQDLE